MAQVFAADEQGGDTGIDVDAARWARLADEVLGAEGVPDDAEISLLFVDIEAMTELNSRFRGAEGPTDVLAFPMDAEDLDEDDLEMGPASGGGRFPDGGTTGPSTVSDRPDTSRPPYVVGDVVICPAVAAANAPEHSGSLHDGGIDDELALLVVHGVLHLVGMDHAEDEEAEAMEARERELLGKFHRAQPTAEPT
ncbi:MAG TPA: rRNA maturation RNase YbeY [Acidimicrobiales bacterium]|nr:rRNA maturation RNase YbeY [Acidimicrobiales bacterium]